MEREGVAIDRDGLATYSTSLENDSKKLETAIYEHAGIRFNIASPSQLGDVLFEKLMLEVKPKKTKTGKNQTGEDILQRIDGKHEIVQIGQEHDRTPVTNANLVCRLLIEKK